MKDGDVDRSYVHCKLCFDSGNKKRAQVKYCGGTTNLTLHLKTWHKADYKAMVEKEEPPKKPHSIQSHFETQFEISAKVAKIK